MTDSTTKKRLSGSLEDYLETILLLARNDTAIRVRDIAAERGVRAPSVSLALARLSDLGLVTYIRRELVELTPEGEREARRIYSRHQILTRFFREILRMSPTAASKQACDMEHVLTDDGMDRLTRFFEFLTGCPNVSSSFLEDYRHCPLVSGEHPRCGSSPEPGFTCNSPCHSANEPGMLTVADLSQTGPEGRETIAQINADGDLRLRLLDKGLLPGVELTLAEARGDEFSLRIQVGDQVITLNQREARAVRLVRK